MANYFPRGMLYNYGIIEPKTAPNGGLFFDAIDAESMLIYYNSYQLWERYNLAQTQSVSPSNLGWNMDQIREKIREFDNSQDAGFKANIALQLTQYAFHLKDNYPMGGARWMEEFNNLISSHFPLDIPIVRGWSFGPHLKWLLENASGDPHNPNPNYPYFGQIRAFINTYIYSDTRGDEKYWDSIDKNLIPQAIRNLTDYNNLRKELQSQANNKNLNIQDIFIKASKGAFFEEWNAMRYDNMGGVRIFAKETCPECPDCPEPEPCPECPECPDCPEPEPCPECPECPEEKPCPDKDRPPLVIVSDCDKLKLLRLLMDTRKIVLEMDTTHQTCERLQEGADKASFVAQSLKNHCQMIHPQNYLHQDKCNEIKLQVNFDGLEK